MEHFLSYIQEYSLIKVPTPTLQAVVFIAGYTVYGYFKNSTRCHSCLSFLTEDKEMEIEASPESIYKLLQLMDRGGHLVLLFTLQFACGKFSPQSNNSLNFSKSLLKDQLDKLSLT